jgi:hypothetical protein
LGRKIISKLDFESCPKMIIEKLARKWAQIFHLVMLLVIMALQSSKMPKCHNFKS